MSSTVLVSKMSLLAYYLSLCLSSTEEKEKGKGGENRRAQTTHLFLYLFLPQIKCPSNVSAFNFSCMLRTSKRRRSCFTDTRVELSCCMQWLKVKKDHPKWVFLASCSNTLLTSSSSYNVYLCHKGANTYNTVRTSSLYRDRV